MNTAREQSNKRRLDALEKKFLVVEGALGKLAARLARFESYVRDALRSLGVTI